MGHVAGVILLAAAIGLVKRIQCQGRQLEGHALEPLLGHRDQVLDVVATRHAAQVPDQEVGRRPTPPALAIEQAEGLGHQAHTFGKGPRRQLKINIQDDAPGGLVPQERDAGRDAEHLLDQIPSLAGLALGPEQHLVASMHQGIAPAILAGPADQERRLLGRLGDQIPDGDELGQLDRGSVVRLRLRFAGRRILDRAEDLELGDNGTGQGLAAHVIVML